MQNHLTSINSAPGYPFKRVLESANGAQVKEFLGSLLFELLTRIDTESPSESDLREIAIQFVDPREALQTKSLRDLTIQLLPIEKAQELAKKLDLTGDGNVFAQLRGVGPSEPLLSFFGATTVTRNHKQASVPTKSTIAASYGLYPHQRDIATRAIATLNDPSSKVVIHMPTGSGKTRTAMHIIADRLRSNSSTVIVWLAQNSELLEQAAEEFEDCWRYLGNRDVSLARVWGDHNLNIRDITDGIVIAGLGKLNAIYSRDEKAIDALADRVSLVVFDEAHQIVARTYKRLVETFYTRRKNTSLIGLTATPGRTWNNIEHDAELSEFFDNKKVQLKVDGYDDPVTYLMDEGYLARPNFKRISAASDLNIDDEDEDEDGDYDLDVLHSLANNVDRNVSIIDAVREAILTHRRIIVFASTVQHATLLTGTLTRIGVESLLITAETDQHARETSIRRFKGNAQTPIVLCNYGVLTTGFDAPSTSCAIIARPTKSLVLYSQMVGRATRGPRVGGNQEAEIITVLDTNLPGFGNLVEAFSNWEDVWND